MSFKPVLVSVLINKSLQFIFTAHHICSFACLHNSITGTDRLGTDLHFEDLKTKLKKGTVAHITSGTTGHHATNIVR